MKSIFIILVLAGFFFLMFFSKSDRNKNFIRYILLASPLLAFDLLPNTLTITCFDALMLIFLFGFYKPKEFKKIEYGRVYLFFFILLLLSAIIGSITADSLTRETTSAFLQLFTLFLFARLVIDECLNDPAFYYTIVECLQILLIISLCFLFGQLVFGVKFSIAVAQNPNVDGASTRYPSYFQDPQKYAQFLAAISFLFLIRKNSHTKLSPLNYVFVVLSLVAILLSGGRAALGGWGVGLIIVIFFAQSSYRFAAVFVCVVMYIVIYNFQDSFAIFKRASLTDSYEFRYAIWQDAYRIYEDHSIFGIGLGNYANYVKLHNPDQFWVADNEIVYFDHPESGYLKFLTELGTVGFCSIFLMVLVSIVTAFFNYLKTKNIAIILLTAAVISWLVGFYTVYSFGDTRIKIIIVTIICLLITSYNWAPETDAE